MAKRTNQLDEMKAFVVSAGCMTIEHISTAIRRSRNTTSIALLRRDVDAIKHFADMMHEDFYLNFPENKRESDGQ